MKIYIAGPMRGYPLLNFPAFFRAAQDWHDRGWDVFNPAAHDVEIDGFDPAKDVERPQRHYARRDVAAILNECDAMFLLRGWSQSEGGALAEAALAKWIGLEIVTEDPNETTAEISVRRSDANN